MIEREEYLNKISPFINKPFIKVISGLRRSGKSTFLKLLINHFKASGIPEKNILYISKELLQFEFINNYSSLHIYVHKTFSKVKGKKYLLIDEVQEIKGWEKAVNSLLAEDIADIYLTGSNSSMLSSELASLLTGRYVVIPMFTLGFKEFIKFRNLKKNINLESEFQLYLKYGGFPGIHLLQMNDEAVFQYIDAIYNTIMLKDIVARYNIRDIGILDRINRFIFDNCANITSAKKITDFLKSQHIKTGVETVQNYLKYLQDAHLVFKSNRYDIKGKKLLEIHEKYYMSDVGIRHSILEFRGDDIALLLENIVYLELLRRGYSVTTGKIGELEIDFIAQKTGEKLYFQVCYLLATNTVEDREFGALEKIKDNYPKFVLSMDSVWGKDRGGIVRKNIIDFLME